MTSDDGASGGLFTRAVRETLDAIVAPLVRDALIHDALALAGLDSLPSEARAVRAFAAGPLRRTTERALGAELAASVAEEVLRTVQDDPYRAPWSEPPGVVRPSAPTPRNPRASAPPFRRSLTPAPAARRSSLPASPSGRARVVSPPGAYRSLSPLPFGFRRSATPVVGSLTSASWPSELGSYSRSTPAVHEPPRASGRAPRGGPAGPPAPRTAGFDAPLVLVATEDGLLFQTLAEWFGARARVCRVRTPIDLVTQIGSGGSRTVVILDGKNPSVRPAVLAVLLEEQSLVEVVLCQTPPAMEQVVLSGSTTSRWIVYREAASLDHVAAECVRLVS
jgi:hypothetical protein